MSINQLNALTSFSKLAENLLEQIRDELGFESLELHTDSLDQPVYPAMWYWEMSTQIEGLDQYTLVQLSLKYKVIGKWNGKRIRQLFLNKLGISHRTQSPRAYWDFYNQYEDKPGELVGKMRVEPVGGQLWQLVPEPDPTLLHDRLRLKIYYK